MGSRLRQVEAAGPMVKAWVAGLVAWCHETGENEAQVLAKAAGMRRLVKTKRTRNSDLRVGKKMFKKTACMIGESAIEWGILEAFERRTLNDRIL